jgi:hypothetical protein
MKTTPIQYIVLIATILWYSASGSAQNLVPNGGFENYTTCPEFLGQIESVIGWDSILNSVDYYNTCSEVVGVPMNSEAYQEAFEGNGYIGFLTYPFPTESLYREVFGSYLIEPMVVGEKYFFSFRLNKGDQSTNQKASNNIGVKFLTEWSTNTSSLIDNQSNWKIDTICYDTTNWNLIRGEFVSNEEYEIVCIGNFYDNENTLVDGPGTIWDRNAYYLIDDFRLSNDSLFGWSVEVDDVFQKTFKVYPTLLFDEYVNIENSGSFSLSVYSVCGGLMDSVNEAYDRYSLKVNSYPAGIYLIKVKTTGGRVFSSKIIKN